MAQHLLYFQAEAVWYCPQENNKMFIALFAVLLIMWILGFTAFHVASGLIHLLLIFAVISLVLHFVRGRSIA